MIVACLSSASGGLAETGSPTNAATTTQGPRIQFAETEFDFGRIKHGDTVAHTFVFTNTGNATLEIKDVRPSCGCTTAAKWDRKVEPGKTGAIPLQFNSTGFSGDILKVARVLCNDPGQTNVALELKGKVWKPIDITPGTLFFRVYSETPTNLTDVVHIVNNRTEPIELSDLQCTNRAFHVELKPVKPGKEFELRVTTVAGFISNSLSSVVSLKTSSPDAPEINVSLQLTVFQPVAVTPDKVMLAPGPLKASLSMALTVRNHSTNSLALSDATINYPEASVQIKEQQPGRLFTLLLLLPKGFQVKPDHPVEISFKSNHPKFPLIKVPIVALETPGPNAFPPRKTAALPAQK